MKVYGIRHHGPGSALRLLEGLRDQRPEIILVEGPADATPLLESLDLNTVVPPISLAALEPKTRKLIGHYPFASFSPEWVAIRYAKENDVPIAFIDQPLSNHSEEESLAKDPLGELARASGYDDAEKWWEVHFESHEKAGDVFDDIIELIQAVRPEAVSSREQFMIGSIARHIDEFGQNCAVICGAWHSPVLQQWQDHEEGQHGLVKNTYEYFWLPWNYEKLTVYAGYSAGVRAPYYYQCLFERPEASTELFLAKAGEKIRSHGFQVSPAQLIDTAHLARQLAGLRHRSLPGIDELWEGLVTILPDNRKTVIETLRKAIFIGQVSGKVDPDANQLPLLNDFYDQLRSFRLHQVIREKDDKIRKLDLRKTKHLEMSRFFYQLLLLETQWPIEEESDIDHIGHYLQYWNLRWNDEIEATLVEKAHYGVTVRSAASNYVTEMVSEVAKPEVLWNKLLWVILAGLSDMAPKVMNRGKELLMLSDDGLSILLSWLNLERIKLYVKIIDFDISAITSVTENILPKLYITLRHVFLKLDDEDLALLAQALLSFHTADLPDREPWRRLLRHYYEDHQTPALINALSMRLLMEEEAIDLADARKHLQYQFSMDREIESTALWVRGFLMPGKLEILEGSGMLKIFDEWVNSLEEEAFKDLVFGLRRSFNALNPGEKHQLYQMIRDPDEVQHASESEEDQWTTSSFLDLFKRLAQADQ